MRIEKNDRKKIFGIALVILMLMIVGIFVSGDRKGTHETEAPPNGFSVYYINKDGNQIASETRKSISENAGVDDLLDALMTDPDSVLLKRTMGEEVSLLNYHLDNGQLILNFDTDYTMLERPTEVLFRASVVHTLCQLKDVRSVSFTVADAPLLDSTGEEVGAMTDRTFIDNAGDEISSYNKGTIHLYFADTTGTLLVRVSEEVVFSANVSMEKLVMEKLIEGPKTKSAYPTISPDTKMNTINVKDGICYVSLDTSITDKPVDVTEEVVLYSIVNSLTELPGIHEVQISINGKTDGTLRGDFPLDKVYSRNGDLVKRKGS